MYVELECANESATLILSMVKSDNNVTIGIIDERSISSNYIKEINAVLCLSELKALTLSLQACFAVGRIETSRGYPFAAIFKPRQADPLMQRNVTIGVRRDKIGMCVIGIGYNLKKKSATLHAHFSYADGLLLLEQLAVFCDCLQTRGHSNDLD